MRFTKFALVGLVATGIQYLLLIILVDWAKADPVRASSAGFIASAFLNYGLNYHYTFRSIQRHGPTLMKFMTLASVGLLLNAVIMHSVQMIGPHYLVAQICASAGVLLWNFGGNSLWTFRSDATREASLSPTWQSARATLVNERMDCKASHSRVEHGP